MKTYEPNSALASIGVADSRDDFLGCFSRVMCEKGFENAIGGWFCSGISATIAAIAQLGRTRSGYGGRRNSE